LRKTEAPTLFSYGNLARVGAFSYPRSIRCSNAITVDSHRVDSDGRGREQKEHEMNSFRLWFRISVVFLSLLFAGMDSMAAGRATPAMSRKSAPCAAREYRQLDFWAGDWDAFDVDKPSIKVARLRVNIILDGCVLLEDYRDKDGSEGESFTIYDASRKIWHQTWVTNRGKLLVIEGNMHNGEMVLSGVDHLAGGKSQRVRGIWRPVKGGVRETAVTSTDEGKTWKPWFDLLFRPHRP
jgi:hypothetical protein